MYFISGRALVLTEQRGSCQVEVVCEMGFLTRIGQDQIRPLRLRSSELAAYASRVCNIAGFPRCTKQHASAHTCFFFTLNSSFFAENTRGVNILVELSYRNLCGRS